VSASAPGCLSAADWNALNTSTGPAAAIALLSASPLQSSLLVADAITAATVEALQGFVEPYDIEVNDAIRNQTGQSASASNIRTSIEGSRRLGKAVTTSSTVPGALNDAVLCAAQVHGPAIPSMAAAVRAAVIEVSAALPSPPIPAKEKKGEEKKADEGKQLYKFHAQPLIQTSFAASLAAANLTAASQSRLAALGGASRPTPAVPTPQPFISDASEAVNASVVSALQLGAAWEAFHEALVNEFSAAEAQFCALEVETAKDAAAKEERRAAAAAEREKVEAAKLAGNLQPYCTPVICLE
jgi:histidine ammonia-lyase